MHHVDIPNLFVSKGRCILDFIYLIEVELYQGSNTPNTSYAKKQINQGI